jgi:presenilin 1
MQGLFCTLLLLTIARKALPALPISIGLGIFFFFVTEYFIAGFVNHLAVLQVFV